MIVVSIYQSQNGVRPPSCLSLRKGTSRFNNFRTTLVDIDFINLQTVSKTDLHACIKDDHT